MDFAVIENNTITNVIVAETLTIAEEIVNGLEIKELEALKNESSILDNRDPKNAFLVIPNIGMFWFRDPITNKWFAPKPEGNFEWNELDQKWVTWVEPIKLWLTSIEFESYNNGTWTPLDTVETTE